MMNLTITPKKSIFDNLKSFEYTNDAIFNRIYESDIPIVNEDYDEILRLTPYKDVKRINNTIKVTYCSSSNIKDIGRVYPCNNISLFTFRKAIRHTIAKDLYYDIDIENCHPSILNQICINNNIKCAALIKYVNDRDTIITDVIDEYKCNRKAAKELFIGIIYGGTFETWAKDNEKIYFY
jgi:hypothetical protein